MRIALLSNVTVEVLARSLAETAEVWCAPGFAGWREIAIAPPPEFAAFRPEAIWLLLDRRFAAAEASETEETVRRLEAHFPGVPVVVPDLAAYLADLGEAAYDERLWHLAAQPWSASALDEIVKLFTPKKAVAVDLDETLWRGVSGEDDPREIAPDLAFQRELKALKERGVLLVALSKNDFADVERVFAAHPEMPLRLEDFVATAINWEPKSVNLRRVATELNLGLEAFLFVDDNSGNRAEMRTNAPVVTVGEFPPVLSVHFPSGRVTDEDRVRSTAYAAEAERRSAARAAEMELGEYLSTLAIETNVTAMNGGEVARVAQLAERTHQFNVSQTPHDDSEVRGWLAAPGTRVFVARSRDRFGDLGLIAFVRVEIAGEQATILDWTMSCRAMNRRIEFAVETEVECLLLAEGVRTLHAEWRRGAKNAPVQRLFDDFGFERIGGTADGCRYRKALAGRITV